MNIYRSFGKRVLDVVLSSIFLIIFSPFFIVAMLLIKLDSKGPVFFAQERMGMRGELFSLVKFRTMRRDPAKEKLAFEPGSHARVTRLGTILRKTKIDELPQLINVLKGDMSLVGPRPEVPKYREFYSRDYEKVLSVRPGITDRASINYRHEEKILRTSDNPEFLYRDIILPDKLKINLQYIENGISIGEDIKLILNTIKRVFV